MTFDKNRVCVAGLHDVPYGTRGYYALTIYDLEKYVTTEYKLMVGIVYGADEGYYLIRGKDNDTDCTMFYPIPEKKYRPYGTLEELSGLIGKVIVEKDSSKRCLVTSVEKCINILYINNMSTNCAFDYYTMEDGSPVGIPE